MPLKKTKKKESVSAAELKAFQQKGYSKPEGFKTAAK